MSEKVTFQELIESIATQSDNSKQFTHDFLKDFVSVINDGLGKNGKVNIAGFGKFQLREMDERDGYNPQTGEKITIPAHNKVVFKPYKDVRELVNAPYAHLESEIIEEEQEHTSQKTDQEEEEEHFIPTAPPPTVDTGETVDSESEDDETKKAPWEKEMESEIEIDEDDPFGLDARRKTSSSFQLDDTEEEISDSEEEDEDIVEYTPEITAESEEPDEEEPAANLDASEEESGDDIFSEFEEESTEESEMAKETHSSGMEEQEQKEPKAAATSAGDKDVEHKDPVPQAPSFKHRNRREQQSRNNLWMIAAAFIILLLAVGAWYFIAYQQGSSTKTMTANQTTQQEQPPLQQENSGIPQASQDNDQQASSASQQKQVNQAAQASSQEDKAVPETTTKRINVRKGQTLWGLADNQYDNPYLWPWIYDTNKSAIKNPDLILIGQSLDVPVPQGPEDGLNSNDSLQIALGYVETYRWYKNNKLEKAKYYLYAAKQYHHKVLQYTDIKIDDADLAFANRGQ